MISTIDEINKDINEIICQTLMVENGMIFPYADSDDFVSELLKLLDTGTKDIISAGHLSAEIGIAADKAGLHPVESLGASPFIACIEDLLSRVTKPKDILYLTNPNKISGAHYSLADIEKAAKAVPQGYVIVDEFYFDFFGIVLGRAFLFRSRY